MGRAPDQYCAVGLFQCFHSGFLILLPVVFFKGLLECPRATVKKIKKCWGLPPPNDSELPTGVFPSIALGRQHHSIDACPPSPVYLSLCMAAPATGVGFETEDLYCLTQARILAPVKGAGQRISPAPLHLASGIICPI